MPNLFLEKSIEISAPPEKIWNLLVRPDWEVDDQIEGKGKILKLEPHRIFKHNVLRLSEGITMMSSIVTYELRARGEAATLLARESFAEAQSDKAFAEASAKWDEVLKELKAKAEV